MNRRDFLRGAAASGLLLTLPAGKGIAESTSLSYRESSLNAEEIELQKKMAVESLAVDLEKHPNELEHIIQNILPTVEADSRMYRPTREECIDVLRTSSEAMSLLATRMAIGTHGLFLFGNTQRLYVIKKTDAGTMQFIKGYVASTSGDDWSNEPDSGGTPLGLHDIIEHRRGYLGEVISGKNLHAEKFLNIPIGNIRHTFVKSLRKADGPAPAEVVTDAYLLVSPNTPASRGIRIHGTNRSEKLGKRDSGGCIRMSSVDIRDLGNYIRAPRIDRGEKPARSGAYIMIHATQAERPAEAPASVPAYIKKRRNIFEEL